MYSLLITIAGLLHTIGGDHSKRVGPEVLPKLSTEFMVNQTDPFFKLTRGKEKDLGLIVIDEISFYLFELSQGFPYQAAITKNIGTMLQKISHEYGIPVVCSSILSSELQEPKFTLSPWSNFIGDIITIQKFRVREHLQPNQDAKIVRPQAVSSKISPFWFSLVDNYAKEKTLTFTFQVSLQSDVASITGKQLIKSEKSVKY